VFGDYLSIDGTLNVPRVGGTDVSIEQDVYQVWRRHVAAKRSKEQRYGAEAVIIFV
jgi:hypothetical protein